MNRGRRLLVVLACVGCLLAVASALPAADPRLEAPGGESAAGEWDAIVGEQTPADEVDSGGDPDDDAEESGDGTDSSEGVSNGIEVSGALEPGNEVTVEILDSDGISHFDPPTIEVNGEEVGEPSPFGRLDGVQVPHAETMTVEVPERDTTAAFDVRTDLTVRLHDPAAPGAETELSAAVGSTPLRDATVSVDGESVETTDSSGRATVTLPDRTGETTVTVERDPIAGTEAVDISGPDVSFRSPLLVPGSLAPVEVTADGGGVSDATVAVVSGDESAALDALNERGAAGIDGETTTETDESGHASLWLPLDDEATVVTEVGGETATATVDNLYLRLTAVIVLVPGFVIGGAVTYLRLARRYDHEPGNEFAALFVALAALFEALADLVRVPSVTLPDFSWPTFRVPRGLGQSIGAALAGVFTGLASLPSLGSLTGSAGGSAGSIVRSGIDAIRRDADDDGSDREGTDGDALGFADGPLGPESPRSVVLAAWHAFCDRVGVRRRETRSPGEVARRALEAGYPAEPVNDLLATLRDVEYGERRPTPDRAARAREAAAGLVAEGANAAGEETGEESGSDDAPSSGDGPTADTGPSNDETDGGRR